MVNLSHLGVIGLGVMGANLARNFASRGIRTAVFNRTYQRTLDLLKEHGNEYTGDDGQFNLTGFEHLEDFVNSLEKPRRIILMVQAGAPVDEVIDQLIRLVEPGDYIIDGGNSFFEDTERRHREVAVNGVIFVGMGISGGEDGALHGPSLMPGLTINDWPHFEKILGAVAAKDFAGNACAAPMGPGGAGHYIKMVHNGIEYAIMQIIAEIYDFNRKISGLSAEAIAEIFKEINSGDGASYLAEITSFVLKHKDSETGATLVDVIMDKSAQKGTGSWTSIESIRLGAAAETIGEAVSARSLSSFKDLRMALASASYRGPIESSLQTDWKKVYFFAMFIAYAQGLHLIRLATIQYKWPTDLAEVCRIWQGGCIIRSQLLVDLRQAFLKNPALFHLLEEGSLLQKVSDCLPEMQKLIAAAATSGIALPATASALNYFLGITDAKSPANLIQGMRDFFGAHTFERTDKPGIFHNNWNN